MSAGRSSVMAGGPSGSAKPALSTSDSDVGSTSDSDSTSGSAVISASGSAVAMAIPNPPPGQMQTMSCLS